ncbi:uncharacterized protein LOC144424625 [Styela clava]
MIEPPTPLYCEDWVHTLKADNIGDLEPTSPDTWSTQNKAKVTYSWPSSRHGQVINAHLSRIQISYDPFHGSDTFCTNNGLLFETQQCIAIDGSSLFTLKYPALNYDYTVKNFSESSPLIGFIQESTDRVSEVINKLTADINYLECQIESILTTNIKLLSKQYPGKILSQLLGGNRAAITVGDILTEIECQRINVTVLRNLFLQGKYATRPLVHFINNSNETIIAQIFPDSNAYVGIHFFENYTPGRIFTFQIDGRFYNYVNYTLNHADSHVKFLRPTFKPFVDNFNPIDYNEAYNELPRGHQGYDDINNMLLSISHINLIRERILSEQTLPNADSTSDTDTDAISHEVQDTFVHALSFIKTSILSGIYMLLFHLSLIWATIWTVCFIKKLCPKLRDEGLPRIQRLRQYLAARREQVNPVEPPQPLVQNNRQDQGGQIYQSRSNPNNRSNSNLYPSLAD